MQQIIGFIVKNGLRLLFLFLLGIALWLTFSHHHFHRSKFVNSSNRISGYVYSKTSSIGEYFSLKSENERLYEENLTLKDYILNQQAKAGIDTSKVEIPTIVNREINVIGATVIENSYRKQKNFLTLKGGEKQGIKSDMGVINDKGIVGIIEYTSPKYATVLSVLNTDFQIVAKVKKNNMFGTLIWDGKSTGFLQLIDIPRIESIIKGDTIVTGFSAKAFPENIPIGTIDEIIIDTVTNNSTLHIRLFNDMTKISKVYVVENVYSEEVKELQKEPKMNSTLLTNIFRFFLLILIQVAVFNNIHIFGYITPYPYILFILLYPINSNRYGFIFWSFLLGLTIDMFSNSGGIHAASCLILAYYRNLILRLSFGLSYEYQILKIENSPLKEQILFVSYSVLIHHFILFTLEAFSFALIGKALLKILLSSIFTVTFNVLIINLFKVSRK